MEQKGAQVMSKVFCNGKGFARYTWEPGSAPVPGVQIILHYFAQECGEPPWEAPVHAPLWELLAGISWWKTAKGQD